MNDEKYNNLKEDQSISESIYMLIDVMKNSPQQRSNKMINRKVDDKDYLDRTIRNISEVINYSLSIKRLKSIVPILNTQLSRLKKGKEYYIKNRRKKVGKQMERNLWIEFIAVRLFDLGIQKQSERVDFIYRLFKEYDFDGCRSAFESEETSDDILDKFDKANMKRSFRLIDKKAMDEYK